MRFHVKTAHSYAILSILFAAVPTSKLFAWGASAHEMINTVAAEQMVSSDKDFFLANMDNLVKLATVPDRSWKGSKNRIAEAPLHFMDWDHYASTAIGPLMPVALAAAQKKLGKDFILQNGAGVWRAGQIYNLLVAAVKSGDCPRVIQLAGVLGHYVGDMSMPMHFSSDYDGQSIGRKGIHAYFETTLVDKQDKDTLHDQVSKAASTRYDRTSAEQLGSPSAAQLGKGNDRAVALTFQEGKTAVASLDKIQAIFKAAKSDADYDDAALSPYLPPLMGLGSASLAELWDQTEKDAGKSSGCAAETLKVAEPQWIPFQ